jgi:hypothetical protein
MHQKDFSRPNSGDSAKTSISIEKPGTRVKKSSGSASGFCIRKIESLSGSFAFTLLTLTPENRKSINYADCF